MAAAYDGLAQRYDDLVAEDLWMRRVLQSRYSEAFGAGQRVLDLGCGTGQDALFLARQGVQVTALDVSSGMLARLREQAHNEGLLDRVEICRADAGCPGEWPPGLWDGIVSSFAALNTVADLGQLSAKAAPRLRGGGRMILHLLAPGRRAGDQRTVQVGGQALEHRVLPGPEVYRRFFRRDFALRKAYGLGFLWPQHWGKRLPASLAYGLGRLEPSVGGWGPLLARGRFHVLDLQLRSPS